MDGACAFVILPAADTECFQIFLDTMANDFPGTISYGFWTAPPINDLLIPANITLEFLPPSSPELNLQENIWDEIREKIFKNYALKSMDKVCDKPKKRHFTSNPTQRWSNPSRPFHISSVQCDA
jgi:hypothetical protein